MDWYNACPKVVKEIIYKASFRLKFSNPLANAYQAVPQPQIKFVKVDLRPFADHYIIECLPTECDY